MKSTNWLVNAALLGLVIALSVLTYKTQQQNIKVNAKMPLTHVQAELVSRMVINKRGKLTVLEKQSNVWSIIQPIKIKANRFRIGSLLKLLTMTNYSKYAVSEINLEQYGLTNPELYMQLDDTKIFFGNVNPINGKRYLLIDNTMYLIDDNFYPLINSQLGTLVDQKLLTNDSKIIGIQTPYFSFNKSEQGLWQSSIELPSDEIVSIIEHWEKAQAFGVHTYRPREEIATIVITQNNSETPITFIVTDKEPWLIIGRPDLNLEYHFNKSSIKDLHLHTAESAASDINNH